MKEKLNVNVFKRNGVFVAECLEYMISVDVKTRDGAISAFEKHLDDHLKLWKSHGTDVSEGLESLKRAPIQRTETHDGLTINVYSAVGT